MRIALEAEDPNKLPVSVNPNISGGRPVFAGTRVPLNALWNNLADGATLDEFLAEDQRISRTRAGHAQQNQSWRLH